MQWTAEAIRRARHSLGWSQKELAQAAGVAERTVNDWERGIAQPRNPTLLDRVFGETDGTPTLKQATETELVLELLTRIEARNRNSSDSTERPSSESHRAVLFEVADAAPDEVFDRPEGEIVGRKKDSQSDQGATTDG